MLRARLSRRRSRPWLASVDVVLVGLLGLAALDFVVIAVAGTAGPFGVLVLPALVLLALAVPLLLVRLVATVTRRAPGHSGARVLTALLALLLAVGTIPARERLDRWFDRRDERRVTTLLDERGVACAERAVRDHPDEPETNPGVDIRPLMTTAMVGCMEGRIADWWVTCSSSACEARAPNNSTSPTLLVELVGYMDTALRTAGHGAWNRSPQPGFTVPPKPWVTPAR